MQLRLRVVAPNDTHADLAVTALEAGKHVVTDKPMCLDTSEADRMIAASELAARRGLWESSADRERHDGLIERLGIPAGVGDVDAATITERTKADKKRVGGRHRFVLARRIGAVDIVDGIDDDQVRATIDALQARCG